MKMPKRMDYKNLSYLLIGLILGCSGNEVLNRLADRLL